MISGRADNKGNDASPCLFTTSRIITSVNVPNAIAFVTFDINKGKVNGSTFAAGGVGGGVSLIGGGIILAGGT